MATWREIDRIRKDAYAFRAMASKLLAVDEIELTEWETAFLDEVRTNLAPREYSTLQAEKLLQIRDGVEVIKTWRGFSVALLLKNCHELRCDLIESDEEWIVAMYAAAPDKIKRRYAPRLGRIACQLGVIEENGKN